MCREEPELLPHCYGSSGTYEPAAGPPDRHRVMEEKMTAELIGEFKGKITGYRITEILMNGPKSEVSFKQSGKLLGVECMDRATYSGVMNGPDVLYGEGQGALMSMSGEMASYRATGTMKMEKNGPMPVWHGVLYFQSPTQKLSALNGKAVIYDYEIDENENTHVKLWLWK
jgi:hypothetical protein